MSGGVQQVRLVLRALALLQLAKGVAEPGIAGLIPLTPQAIRNVARRIDRKLDSRLPRPFQGEVEAAESANTSMVCLWPSFGGHNRARLFRIGPENRACPTLICACFSLNTGWRTRTAVTIRGALAKDFMAQAAAR